MRLGDELLRIGYASELAVGSIVPHEYLELHIEQGPVLEAEGICRAHRALCEFSYTHEFAPTVNSPEYVALAVAAAKTVSRQVDDNVVPMIISEDFGTFLQQVPGNFIFIGNGIIGEAGATPLHNAGYDFNDAILTTGARYFAELARLALAGESGNPALVQPTTQWLPSGVKAAIVY